ncbi:hypothetical protein FACS18949_06730 [Clostridia bacterium]|nr:hypothetical protein FACS18949_06730 [Clostridia bacterium]
MSKKFKRRALTLIMTFAMLFAMLQTLTPQVFAISSTSSSTEERAEALTSVVQNALLGEFEDALVGDSTLWIPLFDTTGIQYAFFVPLTDELANIVGYSIVSDIYGKNTILATCEGSGGAIMANNVLTVFENRGTDEIIAYEFPDAFFIGNSNGYEKINLVGAPVPVADISEFETNTVELLSVPTSPFQTFAISTVYAFLAHWDYGGFVPVYDSDGTYYGGFQGWLADEGVSSFWADRSCGVTAAANALYYMSQYVSGKSSLYTKSNISKASFSQFQKQLYDYSLSPAIWGIPNLSTMKAKVESWASYRGVSLSGHLDSSTWNTTNVKNYIVAGLNSERPVLLETWNSPVSDLAFHWVTVTRIYKDGTDKILTSNWAGKTEYDFATWCNGSSAYKAVLYFD